MTFWLEVINTPEKSTVECASSYLSALAELRYLLNGPLDHSRYGGDLDSVPQIDVTESVVKPTYRRLA